MKPIKLNKHLRVTIVFINALIMILWGGFVFLWYMTIMSDIPPAPTIKELAALERYVVYWFLILVVNVVFLKLTRKRAP